MVAGLPGAVRRNLATSIITSPTLIDAYGGAYGIEEFEPNPVAGILEDLIYIYETSLRCVSVDDIITILNDLIKEKSNDV